MTNLKMIEPCVVFYIFDEFNKFLDTFIVKANISRELIENERSEYDRGDCPNAFAAVFRVDGYFLSVFTRLLYISSNYSSMVINNLLSNLKLTPSESEICAKFRLVKPKFEVIDYAWSDRLCSLVVERQELDHAMSWLSTLGGAFSALGDSFEKCAKVAGKISIQQFKIAFRLGEPPLVARCKLYMALSLIQLGKLATAKTLVQEQYGIAKTLNDFKLKNMCKGVWAKLQYIYKQKKNTVKKTNSLIIP